MNRIGPVPGAVQGVVCDVLLSHRVVCCSRFDGVLPRRSACLVASNVGALESVHRTIYQELAEASLRRLPVMALSQLWRRDGLRGKLNVNVTRAVSSACCYPCASRSAPCER